MYLTTLRSNFINRHFIKLCLLLLWVSVALCQEQAISEPGPAATTEEHDTKELNSLINKYNVNTEKVIEDTSKLNEELSSVEVNESEIEEMRPSSILEDAKNNALKKVREELKKKEAEATAASREGDYSLSVRLALEPLQSLTEDQLKQRITEILRDNPVRHYFDKFPEIITLAIRLIKDKESIPSLVKIAANKERLVHFIAIMLSTIIFGFFLKKLFHNESRSFLGVIFFFILRIAILLGLRIYIIYYFFHVELAPAARVIDLTFLT